MFAEDMSAFFNQGEFAVQAVFTPSNGGAPVSASALFNAETQEIFGDDVLSNEYSIVVPVNSLPGIKAGDSGIVDGVSYRIRDIKLKSDGKLKSIRLAKI